MFRKISLLVIFFIFGLFHIGALELSDGQALLGSGIEKIFQSESIPSEIFSNRGVEADEDHVVFYYNSGVYLFLFNNRVWQVRYDRTYTGGFRDLKIGQLREEILSRFLETELTPISTGDDYLTFELDDSPYPVRMKLYFSEDLLDDLYVYRADF